MSSALILSVLMPCSNKMVLSPMDDNCGEWVECMGRGVEIQCQWHQLSGAKSELGTTGLIIGNLLLSTLLKIIT